MTSEILARAANSSDLEFEEGVVRDADRVVAMGLAGNPLGGLLFRFASAGQPEWGHRIALVLANRVMERYRLGRGMATRVATCALGEFASPHCEACHGARYVMVADLKTSCVACGETGLRRYTDDERRAFLGAYGRRIDDAMGFCHREMSNALGAFLGGAQGRLR